jgi:hypothetical protein
MVKVYMNQNKVVFDMNDFLFSVHIVVNQQEYVMVNVLEVVYLFDLYHHTDLHTNSKVTKEDKHIFLRFKEKTKVFIRIFLL